MNKKMKRLLRLGFDAPSPQKKDFFLDQIDNHKTTCYEFFCHQFFFIRKRVWCLSAVVVIAAVIMSYFSNNLPSRKDPATVIWFVAAMIPFIVLVTICELSRSSFCHMDELELSCRYSLPQVIMTRMVILGAGNFVLLLALILFLGIHTESSLLHVSLYLFVPYLLTCALSVFSLNHTNGSDGLTYCGIIACFVSILEGILRTVRQTMYTEHYLWPWMILLLISSFFLLVQGRKWIKTMEELKWRLSLTN